MEAIISNIAKQLDALFPSTVITSPVITIGYDDTQKEPPDFVTEDNKGWQ